MAGGKNTVSIAFDPSSIEKMIANFGDQVEASARAVAQAGAQVYYDAVKANVAALGSKTGNLSRSIYQVYSETKSYPGYAEYHISWNVTKAPHGINVEFGHWQRYRMYKGADGQVRPMVRPGMDGKKRPARRASRAVKDAYYVTLPSPKHVAAYSFLRRAAYSSAVRAQAIGAMESELYKRFNDKK